MCAAGVFLMWTRSCWCAAGVFCRSACVRVCVCVDVEVCVCHQVTACQVTVKVHIDSWRAGGKTRHANTHLSGTVCFQLGFKSLRMPSVCCCVHVCVCVCACVCDSCCIMSIRPVWTASWTQRTVSSYPDRQVRAWQEEQAAIMIQTAVCQDLTAWMKKWHGADYQDMRGGAA